MRILILTCKAGSGHDIVANILESKLKKHATTRTIEITEFMNPFEKWYMRNGWVIVSLYLPFIVKIYFELLFNLGRWFIYFMRLSSMRIQKKIFGDEKYDAIICTHPIGAIFSYDYKRRNPDCPLGLVITDYYFCKAYAVPFVDIFFVAHEDYILDFKRLEKAKAVKAAGIPIREIFAERSDLEKVRKKYNLVEARFTILVMRGGYGFSTKMLEGIIKLLGNTSLNIQVMVVCGHNEKLKQKMMELSSSAKNHIEVFGYVKNIAEVMSVSDIYLGKPGGISVTECIAMWLPMICYEAIIGQEEGNVKFIERHNIGFYCKNTSDVLAKIRLLMNDKELHETLRTNARKIAKKHSATIIVNEIMKSE